MNRKGKFCVLNFSHKMSVCFIRDVNDVVMIILYLLFIKYQRRIKWYIICIVCQTHVVFQIGVYHKKNLYFPKYWQVKTVIFCCNGLFLKYQRFYFFSFKKSMKTIFTLFSSSEYSKLISNFKIIEFKLIKFYLIRFESNNIQLDMFIIKGICHLYRNPWTSIWIWMKPSTHTAMEICEIY